MDPHGYEGINPKPWSWNANHKRVCLSRKS